MSYMNDDCDPFGIPYGNTESRKEEEKIYSIHDLEEIVDKENALEHDMYMLRDEKRQVIKNIKEKIEKIMDPYAEIEYKAHSWKIKTSKFTLKELKTIEEKFQPKDIKVEIKRGDAIIKIIP